jgi:hypothetical protein
MRYLTWVNMFRINDSLRILRVPGITKSLVDKFLTLLELLVLALVDYERKEKMVRKWRRLIAFDRKSSNKQWILKQEQGTMSSRILEQIKTLS